MRSIHQSELTSPITQLTKRTYVLRTLVQRIRAKLFGQVTAVSRECMDTPKHSLFDYKLEHNFEMRANPTVLNAGDDKGHVRNWRYHLTTERF